MLFASELNVNILQDWYFSGISAKSTALIHGYAYLTRQRKAWHPLAGGQSWPWSMTPWPKINRVPPLIIHNLHVKFESDWAKTEVAIVSTRSYTQSAKVDLDLWPCDPKSIGSSSHHPQLTCEVLKWFGKNWSRYCVHKVLYTKCQSWPWPLTPWPKINRFLLSSSTTYMWSFKVIWQKLKSLLCPQGLISNPRSFFQSNLMTPESEYYERTHWDKLRTVFLFIISIIAKKLWNFKVVVFLPFFGIFFLLRAVIFRLRQRNRRD